MTDKRLCAAVLVWCALGLGLTVSSQGAGPLAETACPEHGIPGTVTCYVLDIAENPDRPDGRTIPLRIMVLKAQGPSPASDPLFVLPGGPGQSAIEEPGLRRFFADFFAPVREMRDIVLVDQRGTGGSNPLRLDPPADLLYVRPEMNVPPEWGRAALDRLRARADLTQYTTARAVEDLDAVRRALGYRRIDLYATSYGTRPAQYYIKRFGAHVRAAVFKGVLPPEGNIALGYGRHPQRALDTLLALCTGDEGCARAYPDLGETFQNLLTRLEKDPVTAEIRHPLTNEPTTFTITRGVFAFGVRSLMMNANTFVQLPALISQAAGGNFSAWVPFLSQVPVLYSTRLYGGMAFSVISSEDVPRLTEKQIREDTDGSFIGDTFARGLAELGGFWPRGVAPADLFTPLETAVPILLVSGALDPATPSQDVQSMLKGLPNARHVVYAGGAHSAANFTGLDRIIAEFIRMGTADGLDLEEAEENRPPPFALPE